MEKQLTYNDMILIAMDQWIQGNKEGAKNLVKVIVRELAEEKQQASNQGMELQ